MIIDEVLIEQANIHLIYNLLRLLFYELILAIVLVFKYCFINDYFSIQIIFELFNTVMNNL